MSVREENSGETVETQTDEEAAGKDESYQIFSAMSYAVILFVIGMPLWWKATEVYRVPLPYSRISALSDLEVKFVMNISVVTLDSARGDKLISDLQDIMKTSQLFDIRFRKASVGKKNLALIHSLDDLEQSAFHPKTLGSLLLLEVPGLARLTPHKILVGAQRSVYFSTDTSAVKLSEVVTGWLLQESSLQRLKAAMLSPTLIDQDPSGRRRVPAAKKYDIMLTVVNPDPENIDIRLDLKQLIREYVWPLLSQLHLVAEFSIKSQWLYFVTLDVEPKYVAATTEAAAHYALPEDILPHLITPLEKKLASHISTSPCVNLVAYVPPCSRSPLHIYRRQGMRLRPGEGGLDAFLSPRWGGIAILNPECDRTQDEPMGVVDDADRLMATFLAQLRQLLGIQEIEETVLKAGVMPLATSSLRRWEMDALLRVRTLEQVTSATLTLQSLAQLLGEISNIVINDGVGESIEKAVSCVEKTAELLSVGNLEAAFTTSKQAFLSAEAAFTDPSLLALLYFPDDQKYAVYIPLFLPVMIPVLLSLRQIRQFISQLFSAKSKIKTD